MTTSDDNILSSVHRHPKYQQLLKLRSRTSLAFFIITAVIYAGFILTLAYDPELFSQPVAGMTISVGVITGVLVALSAVILIAAYVFISNRIFDPLIDDIVRDVS